MWPLFPAFFHLTPPLKAVAFCHQFSIKCLRLHLFWHNTPCNLPGGHFCHFGVNTTSWPGSIHYLFAVHFSYLVNNPRASPLTFWASGKRNTGNGLSIVVRLQCTLHRQFSWITFSRAWSAHLKPTPSSGKPQHSSLDNLANLFKSFCRSWFLNVSFRLSAASTNEAR